VSESLTYPQMGTAARDQRLFPSARFSRSRPASWTSDMPPQGRRLLLRIFTRGEEI